MKNTRIVLPDGKVVIVTPNADPKLVAVLKGKNNAQTVK